MGYIEELKIESNYAKESVNLFFFKISIIWFSDLFLFDYNQKIILLLLSINGNIAESKYIINLFHLYHLLSLDMNILSLVTNGNFKITNLTFYQNNASNNDLSYIAFNKFMIINNMSFLENEAGIHFK